MCGCASPRSRERYLWKGAKSPSPAARTRAAVRRMSQKSAAGIALIVIGLLILVPTGLCTAVLGVTVVTYDSVSSLPEVLAWGGPGIAIGLAITAFGAMLRRSRKERP